jgi:predicted AlkP superfamily phosphohydrolase/phosphomutase
MSGPLIILGIDGLDWRYVDAHRDELPMLAKWPVLAPLRSIFPPDSIPAWTTIFTGVPPAEHGMLDSIDYLDKKRPAHAAETAGRALPNRTFWDEAGRRGKHVCVVNPFLAYPAWDVNGAMVAGPVFVSGEVSTSGIDVDELGPIPELGGIVTFPTAKTMAPFVEETLKATSEQSDFGMRLIERTAPDLFFLNILTVDRMQHFAWRFADVEDPTYPGPNPHSEAVLRTYRLVDSIVASYAEKGRVVVISDHGHGRRCTRMVFVDEVLRRAGLVAETTKGPKLLSSSYLLERAKRIALGLTYRFELEAQAYRLARRLPGRKALKQSTFSSDAQSSPARLSRLFGRNQFGGIDLREDTPQMRSRVREVLESVVDPASGGGSVLEWVRDREEIVQGARIDRYPPVLFKLKEGYGVDFGLYGSIFAPDVNHRRISGGHKDLGVLACSFELESPPESIEGIYETILELL